MSLGAIAAVLGTVLLVAAILGAVAGAFRMHDPERARAFVVVKPDGTYELELPGGTGGTLWFRFDIDGDTDNSYDLLVRGEIESSLGATRAFAVRTERNSQIEGASDARDTFGAYAVSMTSGSIELTKIEASERCVRGTVRSYPSTLLTVGWVYFR